MSSLPQHHEVPGVQAEVQGEPAALRRHGRDRAVLSGPPGHAVSHQEPAMQASAHSLQTVAYNPEWMIHRRPVFSMLLLLLLLMNCSNSAERQIIQYVLVTQWLRCHWIHTCGFCLFCTCDVFGSVVALFHSTVLAPLGSTRLCWLHFMVLLRAASTCVVSLEEGGMIAK